MSSIFYDIHTYLVISFLAMVIILYKFGYKIVDQLLQSRIDKVKNSINNVEKRREVAEVELKRLNKLLLDIENESDEIISEAKDQAENIMATMNEKVNFVIDQKEKEYLVSIKRVRDSIFVEMQDRIIDSSIREVIRILNDKKYKKEMYYSSIENSISMLENCINTNEDKLN